MKNTTQRKGYFTGRTFFDNGQKFTVGKISGWNALGNPVYDIMKDNKKSGELGNRFVKSFLSKNRR